MAQLIGQTLGKYYIEAQIGRGGMATVFKAKQADLNRYVAVKVLPPDYADTPGFSQRFKREAQAIAQLEHPNILPVYDYGQQDIYTYLVMRYIEGSRTLADVMRQPLTLEQSVTYLRQVAQALDYAHRRGIIHRDIKPGNILLDSDDWVFLADFGLARMAEATTHLTRTGARMGTPSYMSPEQGTGGQVDGRTDVYAVGVIAYQMFTGQIPHKAETPHAIIYKRSHEPPPSLRDSNPALPLLVEQSVQTALATDPANRFQTTGAFIKSLDQAIQQTKAAQVMTTVFQPAASSTGAASAKPTSHTPPPTPAGPPCPQCGRPLNPNTTFCHHCGTAIATPQPASQSWLWLVVGALAGLLLLVVVSGAYLLFNQSPATPVAPISHTPTATATSSHTAEPEIITITDTPEPSATPTEVTATPTNLLPTPTPVSLRPAGPFRESFNGSNLDDAQWVIIEGEGQVDLSGGAIRLQSEGRTFPLVYARYNPFPETGDFRVAISMQYQDITDRGSGVRIGQAVAPAGTSQEADRATLDKGRIIEIWQDSTDWHIATGDNLSIVYRQPAPQLAATDIEITYIDRVYEVWVDGASVYQSAEVDARPTTLWLGNPAQVVEPGPWTSLEVDSLVVEPLSADRPATPTPRPTNTPTSTLGQNCQQSAGSTFAGLWSAYRQQIGCPLSRQTTISTIAEEAFQGGHMFWRRDTDQVYVIYDGGNRTQGDWETNPAWNWGKAGEPDPDGIGLSPPPGLVEPKRGFGWVWRTFLGGPDSRLGWALDREYGFDNTGQGQRFEAGVMFKGSGSRIYLLLDNGQFYAQ